MSHSTNSLYTGSISSVYVTMSGYCHGTIAPFHHSLILEAVNQHVNQKSTAALIPEVKEHLQLVQTNLAKQLGDLTAESQNKGSNFQIIYEDKAVFVFEDKDGSFWRDNLTMNLDIKDESYFDTLSCVHETYATKYTDYDWSDSTPLVIEKPIQWRCAESHVRDTISKLAKESESAAQGLDRWALDYQDYSSYEWGEKTGRHGNTVGKNARRGRNSR